MKEEEEPYVRVPAVAKFLNCSTRAVYRYVERGLLPVTRIGETLRFRMSDVRAHLKTLKTGGPSK